MAMVVDRPGLAARLRDLADLAGATLAAPATGRPGVGGLLAGHGWPVAGLVLIDLAAAARLAAAGTIPPPGPTVLLVVDQSDPDVGTDSGTDAGTDAAGLAAAVCAARTVRLPDAEPWLVATLAEAAEPDQRRALGLGVVGCTPAQSVVDSGLVALGLARLAAARVPGGCLLLDADATSPGIDLRAGAEGLPGPRWPDMAEARGRLPAGFLAAHLPRVEGLCLLSADRTPRPVPGAQACEAVLAAVWRGFDVVVADLGTGTAPLGRAVLDRCAQLVLVVPPGVPGVASARSWLTAQRVRREEGAPAVAVHVVAVGHPSGGAVEHVLRAAGPPLASWVPVRLGRRAARDVRGALPPRRSRRGLTSACRDVLAEVRLAGDLAGAA
ncbi:MAG: hypothetical protein U0Q15_07910 [Kineosporiaceae bacterium]